MPSRDDLASDYLDQLLFEPYPIQEEALLAWFSTDTGVLVCAPTGMGKTLIAEAALFEALHSGQVAYYTTPLIALTEQKFQEVQAAAVRWGFQPEDVGLVTGNRKVNPHAKVLVVVAEILLNRLLNTEEFDFSNVASVVMDEFHSFNDRERGIVWELSLGLLPKHVRLLLLSATVGNTAEFLIWLNRSQGRHLDLIRGTERKVPLRYHWVEDQLLNEQLEFMAAGDDETRKTPTLLFCFNREECWSVAEQLKGKSLLVDGQQKRLVEEVAQHDWSQGIGPKLKTILLRGVGVHHAGVLPKYKRIVEDFFQRKLLSVCVCTETLSAGMNLPARSVLMTALLKGPPGRKRLMDPSVAHQIFGRAGRPQFDTEGHVFALAHEDDVKILRAKLKMEQIPEDTRDPLLIKKRKQMKKKLPKRRTTEQYWGETQFTQLIEAPPTSLASQGQIPWRLLAYLLSLSPDVTLVRSAISRRLMDPKQIASSQRLLVGMLLTLESAGCVTLTPEPSAETRSTMRPNFGEATTAIPPGESAMLNRIRELAAEGAFDVEPAAPLPSAPVKIEMPDEAFGLGLLEHEQLPDEPLAVPSPPEGGEGGRRPDEGGEAVAAVAKPESDLDSPSPALRAPSPSQGGEGTDSVASSSPDETKPVKLTTSMKLLLEAQGVNVGGGSSKKADSTSPRLIIPGEIAEDDDYSPERAYATEKLGDLLTFKSINPLYGMFLLEVLPHVTPAERLQALESVLEFPGSLVKSLRIPRADMLPPGVFTRDFLNRELLQRGMASMEELGEPGPDWYDLPPEERVWPLTFPEKLLRLFLNEYPGVPDIRLMSVWAAGSLLEFGGDFNKLVTSKKIARQEGIVFRHVLRVVLLCEEFIQHLPQESPWHTELIETADALTEACRTVDARSTDQMIESARTADVITGGEPDSAD
ncbi:MAG: DEAD/DEAH box helicase [Planctomycetota bacterium]|nr:DEAD/DEAH box helicase [Planctomycetota bacterium]MDA1250643.1 DEAD/DEAH box helicase [Planctomycetota bacterium]